ncbi:hypothetical protein [Armatimonas sp.]|uniref:hypothetical protein n=1 Tax=Armatimonas sp. TaxID=1872638 RepID=UPI00286CC1C5|nr:hypothetical protein [Armatimonas sp.]
MLDLRRFWLLVTLSAKLTLRGYLSSKPALLGAIMLLLVGMPPLIRFASNLHHYPLELFLLGLFVVLVLTPLTLTSILPGSGDPVRLLHYPVMPRTLAAALAAGAFLDPVSLLLLSPILVALPRHFGLRMLVPLMLLTLTAILLGQVLLFLGGALARSRRVRESFSFVMPFVAAAVLLLVSRAPARATTTNAPAQPTLNLSLTPPGLAAQHSIPGCLGLLVWSGGALLLAGKLAANRAGAETEQGGGRVGVSPLVRLAHGPILTIAAKELSYFLREPKLRGALSRSSAVMVAVGVLTLYPTNAPRVLWDSILGTSVVFYLLFWLLERACNQWGTESAAGRLLWSFPGERQRWILGKNLALFPLLLACVAFTLTEYALIAHPPASAMRGYLSTGALWIVGLLALGNFVSIWLPFPMLGKAVSQNPGQDFTTAILYIFIAVAAAYLTTESWLAPLAWTISVPLAGRWLRLREPRVIEALE